MPINLEGTVGTGVGGSVTANWNAAAQALVTIGSAGVNMRLQNLTIGIQNLVGNVTIRMYTLVNGVERQIFPIPQATTFIIGPLSRAISILLSIRKQAFILHDL